MKKLYGHYTFHKIIHLKFTQLIRKAASASLCVFVCTFTHICILFPNFPHIGPIML